MSTIAIIDDDESVLKSIESVLTQYHMETVIYASPKNALEAMEKGQRFDLVLVDTWMPEIDGIKVIKRIRSFDKETPIISMSGHANLESNFEIAKIGANDFIEKPFTQEAILHKVRKLLKVLPQNESAPLDLSPISHLIRKSGTKQRTIRKETVLTGRGIHTGSSTGIILSPMPPNTGLIFEDIVSEKKIYPHIDNIHSTSFNTTLYSEDSTVSVVEHLLSALYMYSISNLLVKVNKEIPVMDGSAIGFCNLLESTGILDQEAYQKELVIDKTYAYVDPKDPTKTVSIAPYDGFAIDYLFELTGFGEQVMNVDFTPDRSGIFKQEIASCRTFGFMEELKMLQANGMGKGGTLDNFLMVTDGKVINQELRFPDEFVRHKILDMCGDLSLLGLLIRGKVTGRRTGHRHNAMLLKTILDSNRNP